MKERARRIHITSSGPRTGTTLLAEVMKTCFEIDGYCDHEAPLCRSNSSFGKCNIILTKYPSDIKYFEKVLKWDPKLFVICLIRDPRDMVCSYHGKIEDKYYCDLKYWFSFIKDFEKLKGHPRVLLIKYEDFTQNPDRIQELIMENAPFLIKKHNFSEFHLFAQPVNDSLKALKKLRPIESKGIGNWKNHLPRIKQQVQEFDSIDSSLIAYGYESDTKWSELLKNVESETFVTVKKNVHGVWRQTKSLILTYLNIYLEKRGVDPDKFLAPFKKVI